MSNQIGQLAKVTRLLPVNSATRTSILAVPVTRQVDEARQVLAPANLITAR